MEISNNMNCLCNYEIIFHFKLSLLMYANKSCAMFIGI